MSRKSAKRVYFVYQQSFPDYETAVKALNNEYKLMLKFHKIYTCFSSMMVLSNVNGKSAERYNLREGLVGRPKWEYRPKPRVRKSIWTKYHIHIVIVGEYAATVASEFSKEMSARFWRKNPGSSIKRNPFFPVKAKYDGLYSKSYFLEQARNTRTIGDEAQLDLYDRRSAKAICRTPRNVAELNLPAQRELTPNDAVETAISSYLNSILLPLSAEQRKKILIDTLQWAEAKPAHCMARRAIIPRWHFLCKQHRRFPYRS